MIAVVPSGWPDLSALELKPTLDTLHLWSQIAGKIRMMATPWENHGWHLPLYVTAQGLGTGLMNAGTISFSIDFDLLADLLVIRTTQGRQIDIELAPRGVASLYAATMAALEEIGVQLTIDPMPNEIPGAIPFHKDEAVRVYDGEVARAYWRALLQVRRVFQLFRTRFTGKCSPIHLFWGSFDLAVTRFSGRPAPRHPGGAVHLPDAVAREAYSQEVSSAGFWPGGGTVSGPAFYSYAYPAPVGYAQARVAPPSARFDPALGEFLMPYADVATADNPDASLLAFLQSTYKAAAGLGRWDRATLERAEGPLGHPPKGFE